MDIITEKMTKVAGDTYADLTPEHIKKLCEQIGSSPDKLRTILNLWFVPQFKPTFLEPTEYSHTGLQDIHFLDNTGTEEVTRPLRLIDLETGNLVDAWNISPLDSYCMLSHRWKGDEITLAHINRAKEKHMGGAESLRKNDIELVLEQSKLDIIDQSHFIQALLKNTVTDKDISELLRDRIKAKDARAQVTRARQHRNKSKAKLEHRKMEEEMVHHLICRINGADDVPARVAEVSEGVIDRHGNLQEYADAYDGAERDLAKAIKNQQKADADAEVFETIHRLGPAVDTLVSHLQLWKSAIKLVKAMAEAGTIFKNRLFPTQGARYIWSDTCCIDKLNHGELSNSLSLMGDWYANAEFCLVHLDTDWQVDDAVNDWRRFQSEKDGDAALPVDSTRSIKNFSAINASSPEWSKRAWTLQELVMSKMTYFTNADWKPLSRPVESLGYVYPLIPFIDMYIGEDLSKHVFGLEESPGEIVDGLVKSEALGHLLKEDSVEVIRSDAGDHAAANQIEVALRLISILQGLGFRFSTTMTNETVNSEMTRSIYVAASSLCSRGVSESDRRLLEELKANHLPRMATTEEDENVQVINFLLVWLVEETKKLIESDRDTIAEFGQIGQLDSWKQGIARSGFSAESVMQLAYHRKATVPVDHVYSLMGILGVRFPSFGAEGYPKALARLLDEAIVAHNDVSVFNWSGVEMGSPVRGRAMYPASHLAYRPDQDRGRIYNELISVKAQEKRKEIMDIYHRIISMLRDSINCMKDKGRKGLPLAWIRAIAVFIREKKFDDLRPHIVDIGKILLYIKDHCVPPTQTPQPAEAALPVETCTSPTSDDQSVWSSYKPSLPSVHVPSSLKMRKFPTFGVSGISKPLVKRHNSEPAEKVAAVDEQISKGDPIAPEPEWKTLDPEVTKYLESLISTSDSSKKECLLPVRIQQLSFVVSPQESTAKKQVVEKSNGFGHLICPNPIIINSSGIEGIFDIQRVIVTMIDRQKLLRQVAKAASPNQKISGWCTVSTGFASVLVNFACEQHILQKELNVEQTVEDKVLHGDRAKSLRSLMKSGGETNKKSEDSQPLEKDESSNTDNANDKADFGSQPTKEEKTTARLIEFVQEPHLQLVAGEWVLARFSGAPGAKWFLCYLELGSTHQFYGHRIATTDIDFTSSTIEPGLDRAWKTYMARKKRKMCNILNRYLDSTESGAQSHESWSHTTDIVQQSYEKMIEARNQKLERVLSFGSTKSTTEPALTNEKSQDSKHAPSSDDDKESPAVGLFDDILDQGKEAAMALGQYTVLAAFEKLCELHANHLDKHLAASVLKKTPKSLQAAVESVDENKGFLPTMFHSSVRVHMF
ncbi:hypothetical protein G7054_g12614 [Neopestalotiopsis clavispora]|nr:hypothetical protein G7054_g12614 [Neopestalotiopsis clavispora]